MRKFTDRQGREWQIALTLGSAMQVKASLEIDLLAPEAGDPPLLSRLGTDEFLLGSVICCLLQGQMETAGVTEADIYAAFDGPTLLKVSEAFFSELEDFFQSRGRFDRAGAVRKQAALMQKAIRQAQEEIEKIELSDVIRGSRPGASPA